MLIRGVNQNPVESNGSVVTIGNFDGVHVGHQALLREVNQFAKQHGLASWVLTFEPHPQEFFQPLNAKPRLTRMREKYFQLKKMGIDNIAILRFNRAFAELSAEDFVKNILVDKLNVKHIVIGEDFHFGRNRSGTVAFLIEASKRWNFTVTVFPPFLVKGKRVSSTLVRESLLQGDHDTVKDYLGRPYSMLGRIVAGDKRGRLLGFPTANILLHRKSTPVQGVYAVRMKGIADHPLPGVANVGTRPTINGARTLLEVHLFDFSADIYGKTVEVEFCQKIRDEKRFENIDLLKAQIAQDVNLAKTYFKNRTEGDNKQ